MANPFKSENYKTNLDSLKKAIEEGKIPQAIKKHNEIVMDLSKELKEFTDTEQTARSVVSHAIRIALKDSIDKKDLGIVQRTWNGIFGMLNIFSTQPDAETPMDNFIQELLQLPKDIDTKYEEVLGKISDLEKSGQEEVALKVSEKARNEQPRDLTYDKIEGMGGNSQEINKKFNDLFNEHAASPPPKPSTQKPEPALQKSLNSIEERGKDKIPKKLIKDEIKETMKIFEPGTMPSVNNRASSATQVNAGRAGGPKISHGLSIKERTEMLKQNMDKKVEGRKDAFDTGTKKEPGHVKKLIEEFNKKEAKKGKVEGRQ